MTVMTVWLLTLFLLWFKLTAFEQETDQQTAGEEIRGSGN
jgi:hypothetical protein